MLRSAVANAETNPLLHWNGDDLIVKAAYADEGPTLKRWRPRARGRVNQISSARATSRSSWRRIRRPGRHADRAPPHRRRPRPRRPPRPLRSRSARPARRRRRRSRNGPESPPRRPAGRRHPRLEVQLVRGEEGVPEVHPRGRPDPRPHQHEARPRRPVRHPDPQGQAADHGRHLHGAPRDRDRQVGRRGRRAPQGAALDHRQERPHQHQRDQAARARREARRPVDRRAAAEPRQLPARDEALPGLGDALGRPGDQDPVRRPPRRRRDEPLGALHRGPHSAAHDPRRHRLRLRRGEDDLRPHRRQGLDQQGRDHAGGLRGHDHRQGHAPRRPGSGPPPPRRRGRGPRRLPRVRPRPRTGSRGSRVSSRSPAARAAPAAVPAVPAARRRPGGPPASGRRQPPAAPGQRRAAADGCCRRAHRRGDRPR